jgi:hypothetical protein
VLVGTGRSVECRTPDMRLTTTQRWAIRFRLAPISSRNLTPTAAPHLVDLPTISTIAELLGAIGVIVSLAYLANQVRHAAQLGQEEAARSVIAKLNATMEFLASGHDKSDLWVRGSTSFSQLEDEAEQVQFSSFLTTFFRTYEELYFYRGTGLRWGGFAEQVRATLASPVVRDWWATRSGFLSEESRAELAPYLKEPSLPLYGEDGYYSRRRLAAANDES